MSKEGCNRAFFARRPILFIGEVGGGVATAENVRLDDVNSRMLTEPGQEEGLEGFELFATPE